MSILSEKYIEETAVDVPFTVPEACLVAAGNGDFLTPSLRPKPCKSEMTVDMTVFVKYRIRSIYKQGAI